MIVVDGRIHSDLINKGVKKERNLFVHTHSQQHSRWNAFFPVGATVCL